MLLCVQTGSTLADPNRFRFDGATSTSRPRPRCAHAVARAARGLRQHAADRRALRRSTFAEGANLMPRFPVPEGETEESWLRQGGRARPARSASRGGVPDAHRKQADYELDVICQMGFPGYFLVVADLVKLRQARAASGSARAVARRPARSSPTRWASPTSTRSSTGCSSSGSSTPSASRCPTSTWTSTSAGAAT